MPTGCGVREETRLLTGEFCGAVFLETLDLVPLEELIEVVDNDQLGAAGALAGMPKLLVRIRLLALGFELDPQNLVKCFRIAEIEVIRHAHFPDSPLESAGCDIEFDRVFHPEGSPAIVLQKISYLLLNVLFLQLRLTIRFRGSHESFRFTKIAIRPAMSPAIKKGNSRGSGVSAITGFVGDPGPITTQFTSETKQGGSWPIS